MCCRRQMDLQLAEQCEVAALLTEPGRETDAASAACASAGAALRQGVTASLDSLAAQALLRHAGGHEFPKVGFRSRHENNRRWPSAKVPRRAQLADTDHCHGPADQALSERAHRKSVGSMLVWGAGLTTAHASGRVLGAGPLVGHARRKQPRPTARPLHSRVPGAGCHPRICLPSGSNQRVCSAHAAARARLQPAPVHARVRRGPWRRCEGFCAAAHPM